MSKGLRIERLARREEKLIIRRVFYLSILSIAIGAILLFFGVSILAKFVDLLGLVFKGNSVVSDSKVVLEAPSLSELPTATNSAKLVITGFAGSGDSVEVFLNDEKKGDAKITDSKFEYKDIALKEGENTIAARAVTGEKHGDFSSSKKVVYDKTDPKLEVETPTEGQLFSGDNRIRVSGKTDKDAQVYVNGFLASLDLDGKFEVFVPVAEGETSLETKAVDQAGNTKTKTVKISYKK